MSDTALSDRENRSGNRLATAGTAMMEQPGANSSRREMVKPRTFRELLAVCRT